MTLWDSSKGKTNQGEIKIKNMICKYKETKNKKKKKNNKVQMKAPCHGWIVISINQTQLKVRENIKNTRKS